MDNRAEDERYKKERSTELNRKVDATIKAQAEVNRQMADFAGVNVGEAVRLVSLYVFYQHGHLVLNLRRAENAGLRSSPHNQIAIREAEASGKALEELQSGDFRKARDYLRLHAQSFGELRRTDPDMEKTYSGAERLLTLIPDHGEPIELPIPAWQDPRYNGEGASQ